MDIATIVGFLGAFGLIAASISEPALFVNAPSLMIVVGGSIMVVMFRSSLGEFLGAVGIAAKTIKGGVDKPEDLVVQITELATIARKDGMIALEGQEIANPFLAKAVGMLVDGTDVGIVKSSLERENKATNLRHAMGAAVFEAWGEIAPAMGMIGTLIGLVQMLANMSDPKAIGPAMAIALLTTMYGAILANIIFGPISAKLKLYSAKEVLAKRMIVEGIMSIQSGDNPRIVETKLSVFLSPKFRPSGGDEEGREAA